MNTRSQVSPSPASEDTNNTTDTPEIDQCSLGGLYETLPAALHSVTGVAIYNYYTHYMEILEAYKADLSYGTKELQAAVHKTHDKSKW